MPPGSEEGASSTSRDRPSFVVARIQLITHATCSTCRMQLLPNYPWRSTSAWKEWGKGVSASSFTPLTGAQHVLHHSLHCRSAVISASEAAVAILCFAPACAEPCGGGCSGSCSMCCSTASVAEPLGRVRPHGRVCAGCAATSALQHCCRVVWTVSRAAVLQMAAQ